MNEQYNLYLFRAPTDCQQYFTGVAGNVKSYNWDGLTQVYSVPQEYTSCFRQEVGYCALDYSVGSSGSSPDYFQVNRGDNVKVIYIHVTHHNRPEIF